MLQVTTLQHNSAPGAASLGACVPVKALTEADAVDIWIARWLRVRRKDLIERYACDPRRIYEVWQEERFMARARKRSRCFASGIQHSSTASIMAGIRGSPAPCIPISSHCSNRLNASDTWIGPADQTICRADLLGSLEFRLLQ